MIITTATPFAEQVAAIRAIVTANDTTSTARSIVTNWHNAGLACDHAGLAAAANAAQTYMQMRRASMEDQIRKTEQLIYAAERTIDRLAEESWQASGLDDAYANLAKLQAQFDELVEQNAIMLGLQSTI